MIRKIGLIFSVVMISCLATHGQTTGMGWGIKGGLNMSGVQTDNTLIVQNNSKLGWQLGVFSKTTDEGWGYLAEASIITMGSKQVYFDESQTNTIGYLTIPIALQYTTGNNWAFLLGGYASFRLWAKRKSMKTGVEDTEANIKDNVAFMDYGVWGGISYSYNRFILDIRYQQGIPNINTNSTINAWANNASGQFSIGYFLK
jgi:hypothetical protein